MNVSALQNGHPYLTSFIITLHIARIHPAGALKDYSTNQTN